VEGARQTAKSDGRQTSNRSKRSACAAHEKAPREARQSYVRPGVFERAKTSAGLTRETIIISGRVASPRNGDREFKLPVVVDFIALRNLCSRRVLSESAAVTPTPQCPLTDCGRKPPRFAREGAFFCALVDAHLVVATTKMIAVHGFKGRPRPLVGRPG
jgi:hypothetical protein